MKTYKQDQEVILEHDEGFVDVVLTVEYSLENDGIGAYEFWGSQEFDHGRTYAVIENMTWDRNKHTPEENTAIEKYLENEENYNVLRDELSERLDKDLEDFEPEDY